MLTQISPRGLTIEEAARYCGISTDTYKVWESEGWVPRPWPGTRRYDKKAVDLALDRMSGIKEDVKKSPLQEWRARRYGSPAETHQHG